jgi:hypothetical protein
MKTSVNFKVIFDWALIDSPTAPGITLSGYKSVKNNELTNVLLPRPDSPTTIKVNSNPFFTDFLCTWFGKFANPTYPAGVSLVN